MKKLTTRIDGSCGTANAHQKCSGHISRKNGKFGEDAACVFLKDNGYSIIDRNCRFGKYELDIVAEDDRFIVFVEVKTRTEAPENCIYTYGSAASAVNFEKKQNTLAAVREYLHTHNCDKQPRIDVIEVYLVRSTASDSDAPMISRINHIRNAFGSGR